MMKKIKRKQARERKREKKFANQEMDPFTFFFGKPQ